MSAQDEAVEMIRRICPAHLSADGYGRRLAEKFDAYRAEIRATVLAEAADHLHRRADAWVVDSSEWHAAAYEVSGLADEHGKDSPARAESTQAADFFQQGHVYAREHHASTIRFLVRHVSDAPDGIDRAAFGWCIEDGDVCWSPFDSDDMGGWTEVTEDAAADAATTSRSGPDHTQEHQ